MEDRRLLIALLLSIAVLFAWQALLPPPEPPPAPAPALETQAPAPGPTSSPPATSGGSPPASSVVVSPGEPETPPAGEPLEAEAEELVELSTDHFVAILSNRGAQLRSFRLKGHRSGGGETVDLVRSRAHGPYPFALTAGDGAPAALNEVLFETRRGEGEARDLEVEFAYRGPQGEARKRFVFTPEGVAEVEIEVGASAGWGVYLGPGLRNPTPGELSNQFNVRSAVYRLGDEVERVVSQKASEPVILPGTGLGWVGLQDTYFLTVLIPQAPVAGALIRPLIAEPGGEEGGVRFTPLPPADQLSGSLEDLPRELEVVLLAATPRLPLLAYLGTKQYDVLASLPGGLQQTVELGWFRFLAVPLLKGLQWIHAHLIQNYGWAIIVMTVLIKVLLFPLTHKSTVSMKKMARLNPQIQAIRQKYRPRLKDKKGRPNAEVQRKMNEEIMALYRSQGVNPAGGCLPVLLQIPILFAFYRLLSTVVELRDAPWVLWIRDLSAPDPYYVLPIVMGGTQFIQQRMTPMSGDPMQRRIFLLMPVFFTVLFLGFPSGLVLYWLTNNVLSIIQQAIYNRFSESSAGEGQGGGEGVAAKRAKGVSQG